MSLHFINAVHQILFGAEQCLYVVSLDEITQEQNTFREAIRAVFLDQGVEIEFSGKGINERGVVIDLDEIKLMEAGYDRDILRFGQTVVRVRG
ncbi:hypothetical protein [Mucilaginibacter ginkgonis]|uniref:Uncharacterized protein n=1 Tax=Mucilaginibacter ginkgonis TaxID=2682091 RepID=A0A6I4HZN9_9SPHI|nr:hypothetical protein [Mucilaginibacter ginkgonis]QQL48805.1 hypothetical protein GO620_011515 [Mucilaginibacter ginkgonis]